MTAEQYAKEGGKTRAEIENMGDCPGRDRGSDGSRILETSEADGGGF